MRTPRSGRSRASPSSHSLRAAVARPRPRRAAQRPQRLVGRRVGRRVASAAGGTEQGHHQDRDRAAAAGQRARGGRSRSSTASGWRSRKPAARPAATDHRSRRKLVFDDAVNGAHDPQTGAQNMTTIVGRPGLVAVIGPLNSSVAQAQIPITNEAGLLQCSPANTNEGLTKPEFGALEIRKARPSRINYVRVVTTDDYQGPAAATYIFKTLGKKNVYIIDDTETFGKGIADNFETEFEKRRRHGRRSRRRAARRPTDYTSIMTAAAVEEPRGDLLRRRHRPRAARASSRRAQAGLGDIPFVGPDGINDGCAATPRLVPEPRRRRRQEQPSPRSPASATSRARRTSTRSTRPSTASTPPATRQGYACAQVVLDAIERAARPTPADMAALREAVRVARLRPDATSTRPSSASSPSTRTATPARRSSRSTRTTADATARRLVFKEQIDFAEVSQRP